MKIYGRNSSAKITSILQNSTFHDELVAAINGATSTKLSKEEGEQMLKWENEPWCPDVDLDKNDDTLGCLWSILAISEKLANAVFLLPTLTTLENLVKHNQPLSKNKCSLLTYST